MKGNPVVGWKGIVALLIVLGGVLMVLPVRAETSNGTTNQFTNAAGNPIMAGDLDRVSRRSSPSDTPVWTEGHRWEPRRDRPHPFREILRRKQHHPGPGRFGPSLRYFLLALLTGALAVRVCLGWIVYSDLRHRTVPLSILWVPVVLVAGTVGAIAYGLFRLSGTRDRSTNDE